MYGQVTHEYLGPGDIALETGDSGQQAACRADWAKKARSWCEMRGLKEHDGLDDDEGPVMKKRKASFNLGLAVDGILQKVTGVGFDHFKVPDEESQRLPPEKWPYLSLAMDQASDNMSLSFFLRYKMMVNLDCWWDMSHGVWRDVDLTVGDLGLRPFVRMATIGLNLGHGPWEDGSRYHQLQESMNEFFGLASPEDPLFTSLLPKLAADVGFQDRATEAGIEIEIWNHLKDLWGERKKGEKVALCRFGKFSEVAQTKDHLFHFSLLKSLYLGMQEDMFDAQTFRAAIEKKKLAEKRDGVEEGSAVKRGNDCVNALRAACKNNVHTMVLVWTDPLTQPRLRVMFHFTRHLKQWYGTQSHVLRSCQASLEWVKAQTMGAIWEPLKPWGLKQ